MVPGDLGAGAGANECLVDLTATDDPALLVRCEEVKRLLEGVGHLGTLALKARVTRHHDVAAVLEGASAREALEGAPAHEHGVPRGFCHEVAHVGAVLDHHVAGRADAPVVADGDDGVEVGQGSGGDAHGGSWVVVARRGVLACG